MADVRSLLRQQRAARRIEHPNAAYSDSGKLLCTLCHEHIKAESLWDGHVRGAGHRQRIQAQAKSNGNGDQAEAPPQPQPPQQPQSNKRKLDDDEDMLDVPETEEEAVRKKRSRPDMTLPSSERTPITSSAEPAKSAEASGKKEDTGKLTPKALTPPALQRRTSGTPVLGVEMQIPSRPATPIAPSREAANGNSTASGTSASTTSTPKLGPGRSPSIPAAAGFAVGNGSSVPSVAVSGPVPVSQAAVDEDEWNAFEADMIAGTAPKPNAKAAFAADSTISAPAMTAEEVAAKAQEEDQEKRKALADIALEDEKEDATRALEAEFEEMEELEARVRKLKERREALRQQGSGTAPAAAAAAVAADGKERSVPAGKENTVADAAVDEEDEEDEDDEDDWAGFRFRG